MLEGRLHYVDVLLLVPASLTNVSLDQTVLEGLNLQLLCEATGKPPPNISWTRVLEDDSNSKVLHHGPTWDFPNINRNASGTYHCTAYNRIGNPVRREVKVNVTCKYFICSKIVYEQDEMLYQPRNHGSYI